MESKHKNHTLDQVVRDVYEPCGLKMAHFKMEKEGKDYYSCQFELNGHPIICRNAKVTPIKVGQFVTFWKRNSNGVIEPFLETDSISFFVVNVKTENRIGQFVFPKAVLIKKGILASAKKKGKLSFRVYPKWDEAVVKQAKAAQKWQLDYFYEINSNTDLNKVMQLYQAGDS